MFERQFLKDFSAWGAIMLQWLDCSEREKIFPALERAVAEAYRQNIFFTPYMQRYAVRAIAEKFLVYEELQKWGVKYLHKQSLYEGAAEPGEVSVKEAGSVETGERSGAVGIIAAGNIPLVVFHDFMCAVACGERVYLKLSHKDNLLLPALLEELFEINPIWRERICIVERIPSDKIGSLLFMGSDSTSKKIENESPGVPVLMRKTRFSFAILSGEESNGQLSGLGEDIFLYYGLGCRNVSTLLLPKEYDMERLIGILKRMEPIVADEHYLNIYKRNKALAIIEGEKFIDGGFFLCCEGSPLNLSPGIINLFRYTSEVEVASFVKRYQGQIQKKYCIFGEAQRPGIFEYPDNTDTVDFILTH